MWITKNDLRTHINQFIDKKQSALKHFLMNEYGSFSLNSRHQYNAEQIWCEARPRSVRNRKNRPVYKGINLVGILCRDINIIAAKLHFDSQSRKYGGNNSKFLIARSEERRVGKKCKTNKA